MRTCKVCGHTKEESDFYGKIYTCKRCVCEINSKRAYKRNLEREPDIKGEIWKPYKKDSRYMVSSIGRIRGIHGQILSPVEHRQGYLRVRMGSHSPLVHRIVAETFLANPDSKRTVNHINGIKYDNRVENLEWATQSENNMHAVNTGLRKYTLKQWECQTRGRKLSKHQVNQIKSEYFNGKSQAEIADIFHVSRAHICRIVNNISRNSIYQIK